MKKITLILLLSSGIVGCVDYSSRPFLREKFDCGNGKRAASKTICYLDSFGY